MYTESIMNQRRAGPKKTFCVTWGVSNDSDDIIEEFSRTFGSLAGAAEHISHLHEEVGIHCAVVDVHVSVIRELSEEENEQLVELLGC